MLRKKWKSQSLHFYYPYTISTEWCQKPIFKDEHNENRFTEIVELRPKRYCLADEKNVVQNAAKGVSRNFVIDGKRTSVKNIDLYRWVLEVENKKDAVINYSFKRINNQKFAKYYDGADKDDNNLHG